MTAHYLLCPGLVRSRVDGDVHRIDPATLAALYRVPLSECEVMPAQTLENHQARMALLDRVHAGELVGLTPRPDGDYRLPTVPLVVPVVHPGQRGVSMVEGLLFALGVALILSSCVSPGDRDRPRDSTDAPTGPRSGMAVRVDALTGCQYLADVRGGLTPRLGPDGRQLCGAGVPR